MTTTTLAHASIAQGITKVWCVDCFARATTVAELTAIGKPAILIPFPYASDNHQELNARSIVRSQAAEMILENSLTGNVLAGRIRRMASNPEVLSQMALCSRKLGNPFAAETIVEDSYALV